MCIAIYIPKNKQVSKSALKRCYEVNSDGFGYAYFNNGHLIVRKFVDKDVIPTEIEKFHELRKNNLDKQFIVHFRIATHGAVGVRCCHPFVVNRGLVFCHNGILDSKFTNGLSKVSDMSDTMMFNKLCLQKLPRNFMDIPLYKFLLENSIGYSKMILMNKNGNVWILNEKNGYWDGGVWYSNSTYKKVQYTYFGNNYYYDCGSNSYKARKHHKNKAARSGYSYRGYDDFEDYPYGNYGTSGWSNYGNGYSNKNNDANKSQSVESTVRGVVVDTSGNVVTPGDKENNTNNNENN